MKQVYVVFGAMGLRNTLRQVWELLGDSFASGQSATITVSTSDKPTDLMRRKFHAMCGDLAEKVPEYKGAAMNLERWKAVAIAAAIEQEWLPAWGGHGVVPFRKSSEALSKRQYCDCIEVVGAIGATYNVEWSEHEREGEKA